MSQPGRTVAERYAIPGLDERQFAPEWFWRCIDRHLRSDDVAVEEIGRSVEARPLRSIRFGRGRIRVLLWSQMHGDESTGTRALADIVRFLDEAVRDPGRRQLHDALTITIVPMLNPDGAARSTRANALGIDVNRDAARWTTPEARALRTLRDRIEPDFAFNLHDQSARWIAGADGQQVALALLAPASDERKTFGASRTRARLVAASVVEESEDPLAKRMARYDDDYNPRSLGEWMQASGTSTLLVESGATSRDPHKKRIRLLTLRTLMVALYSIADGSYEMADADSYDNLPPNVHADYDVLLREGRLAFGSEVFRADLGIHYEDPVVCDGARLAAVGDLSRATAVRSVRVERGQIHVSPLNGEPDILERGARVHVEVRRRNGEIVLSVG